MGWKVHGAFPLAAVFAAWLSLGACRTETPPPTADAGDAGAPSDAGAAQDSGAPQDAGTDAGILNLNLSSSPFAQDGEPFIAVNPTDPMNLIVSWMHIQKGVADRIAVRATTNGGLTWTPTTLLPHDGANDVSADPSIAFDRSGRAHLTFIDWVYEADPDGGTEIVMSSGGDYYSQSSDKGKSWTTPSKLRDVSETPDFGVDRPWVAVDTSASSRDGWIYVVTRSLSSTTGVPRHVHLKVSANHGASWSKDIQVDTPTHPNHPDSFDLAVVGADGTVDVVYLSPTATFVTARSADGAATFSWSAGPSVDPPASGYFFHDVVAANPSDAGGLLLAWTDKRYNGTAADILAATSPDNGVSWSTPARVNDDPMGSGVGHDFPWLAIAPSGRAVIDWRDRRLTGAGPYTTPFDIEYAYSDDRGHTFSTNRRLSMQTSPSPAITQGNDFYGVAATDGALYAAWSSNQTQDWEIFFGSAPLP